MRPLVVHIYFETLSTFDITLGRVTVQGAVGPAAALALINYEVNYLLPLGTGGIAREVASALVAFNGDHGITDQRVEVHTHLTAFDQEVQHVESSVLGQPFGIVMTRGTSVQFLDYEGRPAWARSITQAKHAYNQSVLAAQ